MDPGLEQDIDGCMREAEDPVLNNTEEVASREPRPSAKYETNNPQRDQSSDGDGGALASVDDPPQLAAFHQADEATSNNCIDAAGGEQLLHKRPPDKHTHSKGGGDSPAIYRSSMDATTSVGQGSIHSDEQRPVKSPPRLSIAGSINGEENGESSPKDTRSPGQSASKKSDWSASSVTSSLPGSPGARGGSSTITDEDRSLESAEEEQDDGQGFGGPQADAGSDDLPTQLTRLWGASSPPDREEGLKTMRNMLKHREDLDAILSRLMAAKVQVVRMALQLSELKYYCCTR